MNDLIGTGVALVTPFNEDRSVDFVSLKKLINYVIDGGVDYLVVMGTTGESPTIAWEDQIEILEKSIEYIRGRKPIVFGLGGNNTYAICEKSQVLSDYPVTAILSASPHYNRPSQKGILAHYEAIADSSPCPIILYNVPARTASNIESGTSIALSKHDNIIGLKEASGNLSQYKEIQNGVNSHFLMLSGDDSNALETIMIGGHGIISVAANLIPEKFSSMVRSGLEGKYEEASLLNEHMQNIYKLSVAEGNPTSIKTGLMCKEIIKGYMRLPLIEGSEELASEFRAEMT